MSKFIALGRGLGVALFFMLLGSASWAVFTLPNVNGPSTGDWNVNVYTLAQAIGTNTQQNFSPALVANGTTQATCTAITNPLNNFTTVASSGAVCLPPALGGREVMINNAGANTIQLFGSNSPFTSGTQDTINGITGSTAYTAITTTNLSAQCFSPANGVWSCSANH